MTSHKMNEIIKWSLFLCLAIAVQLSSAAGDNQILQDNSKLYYILMPVFVSHTKDIPCDRRDGNPGFCKLPGNCVQIAKIMDEKKRKGKFTTTQISYVRSSGSSDCSKVSEHLLW